VRATLVESEASPRGLERMRSVSDMKVFLFGCGFGRMAAYFDFAGYKFDTGIKQEPMLN
jgi:hypothetical protein